MQTAAKFPWLDPFESSASAIWLRNSAAILLWVNDPFVAAIGRPRTDLLGKKMAHWLPGERKRSAALTKDVIESRRGHDVMRSIKVAGDMRWFQVHHAPVPPERTSGHGWCVLASAVEVTDQVHMAALRLLLGLRKRDSRKLDDGDERFVRLLVHGTTIRGLCTALQMSVTQVTARLAALTGTPLG